MTEPVVTKHIIQQLLLAQPIGIPIFHEVALRLQQMMNDRTYRIEEAIKLVNEDTALASIMLRYANSTYNSGKAPITTIKSALVRLGSQQVVNLAFTASIGNTKSDNPVINMYLKKLWHHCHTVAITSAWLAAQVRHDKKIPDLDSDEVYLAGLFHDIGKLYLLKSIDMLMDTRQLHIDNCLIDEILDELSIQEGSRVMKHWNIPEIYINSLERHTTDCWQCGLNDYLVAAVRLSCKITTYIDQGIEVTERSEAFDLIKEELLLLDIEDVAGVYTMAKVIAE